MISIILTTYNSQNYILETLQSINNQTFKNWELIIIDDKSTDKTLSIIKNFFANKKKKIYIHQSKKNSGSPALPRNIGIKKSKRKFLAFIDDDDIWHPKKLEKQINFILTKNYDLVSSSKKNFYDICEIKRELNKSVNTKIKTLDINYNLLLQRNIIPLSSILIKKKVLVHFSQNRKFFGVEDYLFLLTMLNKKIKVCKILHNLVFYRVGNNNIFSSSKLSMSMGVIRVLWELKLKKKIDIFLFFKSTFNNFYKRLIRK